MTLRGEPVAVVTLVTSVVNAAVPIMLLAHVTPNTVAVIAAVLVGWEAAALIYVRSLVVPAVEVALTNSDVSALNASPQTPQQPQRRETDPQAMSTPQSLPGGH